MKRKGKKEGDVIWRGDGAFVQVGKIDEEDLGAEDDLVRERLLPLLASGHSNGGCRIVDLGMADRVASAMWLAI